MSQNPCIHQHLTAQCHIQTSQYHGLGFPAASKHGCWGPRSQTFNCLPLFRVCVLVCTPFKLPIFSLCWHSLRQAICLFVWIYIAQLFTLSPPDLWYTRSLLSGCTVLLTTPLDWACLCWINSTCTYVPSPAYSMTLDSALREVKDNASPSSMSWSSVRMRMMLGRMLRRSRWNRGFSLWPERKTEAWTTATTASSTTNWPVAMAVTSDL